jgi:hypothetical protein
MKKMIGSLLLASALAIAGSTASAANIVQTQALTWTDSTSTFSAAFGQSAHNKTFLENFTFNIDSPASVSSAVVSIALGSFSSLRIDSLLLSGNGLTFTAPAASISGSLQVLSLYANNLLPGAYTLSVAGKVLGTAGGSFAGNINISPVSEASNAAMMLGGLAMVGVMVARRRRKNGGSSSPQGGNLQAA